MTEQDITRSPFSIEQEKDIFSTAQNIEDILTVSGITLTMGGEPTFVPKFADGGEWSTDALGPTKLSYARKLMRCLVDKYYPGALVMQVFGKWYPGEPLPRWVLLGLWAEGGEIFWHEHDRLLQPDQNPHNTNAEALSLIQKLAQKAGSEDCIVAASNPEAEINCGWILPLEYTPEGWQSDRWPFNTQEPIELLLGDSPIGLRIPLFKLGENTLKTALTVEARDGALEVFLPPLRFEGFYAILTLLEQTILELDLSGIVICGYAPTDTREGLTRFGLAADPGVLEANVPPAKTWQEYQSFLHKLCDAASDAGLCSWKARLNGHLTGTGGGNHLCFGGLSAETSPFLTRPALLASVIKYWQHHPALSYLFTGQFIGPSSQAPRADEGVPDALYELEIACRGACNLSIDPDPKMVQGLFCDLLIDRGGNTHRAEICIDKLWNSQAPNGRWGIVEFRAFEMFPSFAINALIALFVRAIIARLAKAPFTAPFRQLGKELHDKYFLPACLKEDLHAICEDLQEHGIHFDPVWFDQHFAFRFPLLGRLDIPNAHIEVRQALESWPLLREQPTRAATARHVDSSTDRLEVRISDAKAIDTGYLLINGYPVRFLQAGDQLVCGVRYKAVKLAEGLHPHIESHNPIMIEWVDKQASTVRNAAAYHFWNPERNLYDGSPLSLDEAAKRMQKRWVPANHNIGAHRFIPDIDFPYDALHTLDLRRYPVIMK